MAGYQVMPRMNPERYAALEADIIANGVQEPIKVSESGVIVDGHHRDEIARKHDLHCPRIVIKGDDAYLRDRAYTLNGARRDLTSEERRVLAEKSLRSDPILRDSDHARRTGMDRKTVKRIRESLGISTPDDVIREYAEAHPGKTLRELAQDLGVDKDTVHRVLSPKREFPEKGTAAPEREPTPMARQNGATPEWEDVGTIPQSRLKDIARPTATSIPQSELDELNAEEEVRPVFQAPGEPDPEQEPAPRRGPVEIDRELEAQARAKSSAPDGGRDTDSPASRNAKRFEALILARNILKDSRTLAGMLADTGGIRGMQEHLEDIATAIEAAVEANNGSGFDTELNNLLK